MATVTAQRKSAQDKPVHWGAKTKRQCYIMCLVPNKVLRDSSVVARLSIHTIYPDNLMQNLPPRPTIIYKLLAFIPLCNPDKNTHTPITLNDYPPQRRQQIWHECRILPSITKSTSIVSLPYRLCHLDGGFVPGILFLPIWKITLLITLHYR